MQVKELLELTTWIDKHIKAPDVAKKVHALHQVLEQNKNARNNQQQQPFEDQKNKLIKTIEAIDTASLTNEQERMLTRMGILDNIGPSGVAKVEDILFRNSLDVTTASNKIKEIFDQVSSATNTSDQLKSSLSPLVEGKDEDSDSPDSSDVLMSVRFQNEVSLSNVTDFKRLGSSWWEIGRGIAMAHDCAPEDVRIVGAQKGSIVVELAVIAAIATTTSTIILAALKVAERVLSIRKQVEELKGLKLSNKKLEAELEKEADKEKKEGLERIAKEVADALNINQNGDGEKYKVLEKSVKNLVDFVEKGGEVDFFSQGEDSDSEEHDKLKSNFSEIKKLEKRVLQLERAQS
ncbi:hypothetical protein [Marinobacter sp.]|uniref:hypothetical protein n=1 Tax=Marinobacter sp. TaxID=50741 RepID=UPI003569CD36